MDSNNINSLEHLLSQPMPKLSADSFVESSVLAFKKQASIRFCILQVFALIAVLSFVFIGPVNEMIAAISQFSNINVFSIEQAIYMFAPILMLIGVGLMVKDELS